MKLAIVGGISDYSDQTKLEACANDAVTFRSFLEETKMYADICFLDFATTGIAAKKSISDFVQKHRNGPVEELIFYFSGHGDRVDDDFLYAFSDYKTDKRETTGLRNTELDSLIRNLAPELTVKIVDACYSGSTYIKGEDDIAPIVQKSAKENQLNKLYFFHSSAADQTSLAGPKFSWFTRALFESLVNLEGTVRYRDLIAAVADEMNLKGGPRPTFVVQADNLEIFTHMNPDLTSLLAKALAGPVAENGDGKDLDGISGADIGNSQVQEQSGPLSLVQLAATQAKDAYCTQQEAEENIKLLLPLIDPERWPDQLKAVFELHAKEKHPSELPNRVAIGRWINGLKDDSVFAVPAYVTETYKVDEYKEIPKKPSSSFARSFAGSYRVPSMREILGEDKDYKLETVEKKRSVVSGFEYTVNPVIMPHVIFFKPKFPSLEEYSACFVLLFSRRLLTCLYSVEHLPLEAWSVTRSPKASHWKQQSVSLKNTEKIEVLAKSLMQEVCDFIEADVRQRLS